MDEMSHKIMKSVMESEVVTGRQQIAEALLHSPIPPNELLRNLGLFVLPMEIKRFLFFDSLYRKQLNTPGVVLEFGCRWGQNLAVLQCLRAIYEPYNFLRKIVGFDTFSGLSGVTDKDGRADVAADGAYGVGEGYEKYLDHLLALKESQSPMPQVRKYDLIKGNAPEKLEEYLRAHPEVIVSFAYFDMDIYEPTVQCLRLLKGRLTKGSVVGFDELNFPEFPGETVALQEAIGLNNVRLRRNRWCANESFFIFR
jgi:hypothetical protein